MENRGAYVRKELFPPIYPFVKWAGGKTQLLHQLNALAPTEFDRYFEPFLGGGAFFFYLLSKRSNRFISYLSDINRELINSYEIVKNDIERLIRLLKKHEIGYLESPSEYYYHLRDILKVSNNIEKAARFIALNRTCYNGLYRVNNKGSFNVPWGKYKDPVICDSKNLRNLSFVLQLSNIFIQVGDYKEILLKKTREGDFIYLDPPYKPTSSTAYFTGYTTTGFTDKDQKDLADIFEELNERKCMVMLSNSNTPLIKKMYTKLAKDIKKVNTIRSINCMGSGRAGHNELIIRNYS
ncbi:MAG: Dam family site-specific DNA-(adenine-N6)-methyltransferase [Thermoproteota archaeon]|nr:Dam family site-specific DNA-(adenine-N6)-methyltransferase [Thermoproteota archaeon]